MSWWGAVAGARCGPAEGPLHKQVGSFVGSCLVKIYSKKVDYQLGRPDLNRRPLDPRNAYLSPPPGNFLVSADEAAHRRAGQSGRAHVRAPVIPTPFPAATAAAS